MQLLLVFLAGLFRDSNPSIAEHAHRVGDSLIIECRSRPISLPKDSCDDPRMGSLSFPFPPVGFPRNFPITAFLASFCYHGTFGAVPSADRDEVCLPFFFASVLALLVLAAGREGEFPVPCGS